MYITKVPLNILNISMNDDKTSLDMTYFNIKIYRFNNYTKN